MSLRNKKLLGVILSILLLLAVVFLRDAFPDPSGGGGEDEIVILETAEPGNVEGAQANLKFRSQKLLNEHYEKHGIEMGFDSAKEYEAAAAAVIANPDALHKTEKEDGDDVYYVEATNEFVVVSKDGYLRTYFLPDGGKKYYDKQ